MKKYFLFTALCCTCCSQVVAQFSKILTGPHVTDGRSSYGAAWTDYDADGDDDLFVTVSLDGPTEDLLYQNNGDGTFTKITNSPLVTEAGTGRNSTWGDYNNDGYADAFVVNQITTSLFKNISGTQFDKIAGLPTTGESFDNDHSGAGWGDYDGDGDLDLYLSNYAISDNSKNVLYENMPGGFVQSTNLIVSEKSSAYDPSWIDFDNNGTLDLFVPNYGTQPLYVYKNNGDKTFTKITAGMPLQFSAPIIGMAWADYDNDGDFDVAFASNVNVPNYFYENNGDGTFTAKPHGFNITSVKSSTLSWADFDNDGNIDIVCAGGDGDKIYLFKNNGDKTFNDVTVQYGLTNTNYTWGAATADYDKDGFVDIFLANASGNLRSTDDILYRNNGNANRWISIKLKGVSSNHSAIGANVSVFSGNKQQKRTIQSKTGPNSQNSLNAHFGLAGNVTADSIVIEWPLKGFQILTDVASNQYLTVEEASLPERPSGLTGENVELETITLNWTDNSSNETGFRIERSEGDKAHFKWYAEVGPNVTTFTDEHADVRTIYFYRVFAKNSNGLSFFSEVAEIKSIILGTDSESLTFSVYPNPMNDYLTIVGATQHDQFDIKTILGQTVKKIDREELPGGIFVGDLPAGVYVLTNKRQSLKIIKSK